jgi:uncharacterized protein (TIGR02265 family)
VADRYIYQVAVEAFFQRALGDRLGSDAKARLRDAGLSLDEPLQSVYPAEVFHRCVALAAQAAFPELSLDDACQRAGTLHIDAFVQSYPGKMMSALARQIAPQMVIDYTATFIRLGNNFTESRTRVLGPTRCELWLNDVGGVPGWYRGVLQRGFEVASIRSVQVRLAADATPPEATFDVSWDAR